LAADSVEARVCERQSLCVPLDPLDRSAFDRWQFGRDREHGRIQVQSRDATVNTDRFCRQPRDQPRAARHVENTQSWPQRGKLDDTRAPRPENGRHQLALVDLSRVARDLPSFALRHAVAAATLRRAPCLVRAFKTTR
jgi:hypothetical protein